MGDTLIIDPIELPAVPAVAEGTGAANLLTYDPREVWRGADLPSVKRFHIDLLSDQQFDCVYLGNTNADANSSWTLGIGTQAQGAVVTLPFQTAPMQLPVAGRRQARGPSLYISPVTLTARYLYIDVYKPAGNIIELGNMILGKAFRPAFNRERGAQRTPFDSGIRTRLTNQAGRIKAGKLGRGRYAVLAARALKSPDEIWSVWNEPPAEAIAKGARAGIVRRYIATFDVDGEPQTVLLVVEIGADGWTGKTWFAPKLGKSKKALADYLDAKVRGGVLQYRRADKENGGAL